MLEYCAQFSEWLISHVCVCCGFKSDTKNLDLCTYCRSNLPWLQDRCYQCGAPMLGLNEAIICARCQDVSPNYDRLCALFSYEQPLSKLINGLKFGRQLYVGKLFAALLVEAITTKWYVAKPLPELIIPVPLHIKRLRQRGYNQAIEIAQPIAKALHIPLAFDACLRTRYTPPQARLQRKQRLKNLTNSFQVNSSFSLPEHVALIDDVVTTGSTIRSICKPLRAAGVQSIDIWCVCTG